MIPIKEDWARIMDDKSKLLYFVTGLEKRNVKSEDGIHWFINQKTSDMCSL